MKVLRSDKWMISGTIDDKVVLKSLRNVDELVACTKLKFVDVANDIVYFVSISNGEIVKELSYASQRKRALERDITTLKAMI